LIAFPRYSRQLGTHRQIGGLVEVIPAGAITGMDGASGRKAQDRQKLRAREMAGNKIDRVARAN